MEKDAQAMADAQGVQIFTADIIYHLFGRFTAYIAGLKYVFSSSTSLCDNSYLHY